MLITSFAEAAESLVAKSGVLCYPAFRRSHIKQLVCGAQFGVRYPELVIQWNELER